MSDSVRPHGLQPTRLPCPWDSPGKNTGVGCHFLLQCMKVKSKSEVAQSCLTLSDPMDCSPPGSSIHGIFQARVLEWGAIAFFDEGFKSPLHCAPPHSGSPHTSLGVYFCPASDLNKLLLYVLSYMLCCVTMSVIINFVPVCNFCLLETFLLSNRVRIGELCF